MNNREQELYEEYKNLPKWQLNNFFISACSSEKNEEYKIKYLLTSKTLTENADIHINHDLGFRVACQYGNIDTVKFLSSSLELKDHEWEFRNCKICLNIN